MILTINNISKKYGAFYAVNNFSIELHEGIYGLLGPNGAGKSTIMNMIVDILNPTEGEILLDGVKIQKLDKRYRDLLGYLPQNPGMYNNFTAMQFLLFVGALKGIQKKEARLQAEKMLALVNLKDVGKKRIGTFSGGMRQRLGIAQAMMNSPKILILDEPTAGLDPKERTRFRNMISELSGDRIIILSTHIVSDVDSIAREVILIKEGRLLVEDKTQNLLQVLEGKVWETEVPSDELSDVLRQYRVGNIRRENEQAKVRIISEEKPMESSIPARPTLDDIYLYYFEGEGDTDGTFKNGAI